MPEARSWQVRWWLNRWRQASAAERGTWRLAAVSTVTGLAVATASVVAAGPWDSGQRTAERDRAAAERPAGGTSRPGTATPPSAAPVLAALGAPGTVTTPGSGEEAVPPPTGTGLADALEPLLEDGALGDVRTVSVVDADSGRQVYGVDADRAAVPASVIKLATGAAVLSARGSGYRLTTRVVSAGHDRVVLVGGGDPTLTARPVHGPDHPASLRELADGTASALKRSGVRRVSLGYDTSLYSGSERHPIGPNENLSPVTPLMVDEGRLDKSDRGPAPRSDDPAGDAARAFAKLLRDRGVEVKGEPRRAKAGRGAKELAAVHSQPLSALVERMLTASDNDLGEALLRQTAIAARRPADFAGGGRAVTARLKALGLPLKGVRIADGSGLDRADRVPAALLAQVLVRAASPDHPELRPLITGLPVAGFTGTLRGRYAEDGVGRGVVRAKTGTLTGVNSLAGTVVDADGRLLVFAFMTTGTTDPAGAQHALDRLASTVANCGCR
ncbi:D-alanyl-D-alanine carboxypeptidase/D-alanyl-D-alanine endopeptidase [Streptomyces palmae]|uniref:D-alanyl-D-alanine carboxypeptidase/D-alanyl-D-alanine-endopeptidase n=1 Tax=Streptomyces palmae TaxID=1701085 RepID=A0A4Z0HAM2_9ACTN|nr:D-alanyl-D-alanine carboxypeptidase/D-alanyl-D-alanine-endopeptidase [Streptomyces palmae]TGB15448.1 D-alanyl-D-alanine carboxypeptidase/D-alanyl-D-alanine-endopeptidase [Streptomyces palmae]